MRRYIVGRLLLMIPTLIGVAILTFVIMRAVPGDIVALRYAGSSVPQEVISPRCSRSRSRSRSVWSLR